MQTALELYFNDWGTYPADVTSTIASSSDYVYMVQVPTAPTPPDGTCSTSNAYAYTATDESGGVYGSYTIGFCLGGQTGGYSAGAYDATPGGVFAQ